MTVNVNDFSPNLPGLLKSDKFNSKDIRRQDTTMSG